MLYWGEGRKSIAHVPQEIYLADSSFMENIAPGIQKSDIDMHASRQKFMITLWLFLIGTIHLKVRGISLSGGQKQRIGIAKVSYKKPSLIVFYGATSALDMSTE
jgi:ABC-type multidrug transport system fused ATPase/permease subunit